MSRKKHTAEEIINKLREAEVSQSKGMSIEEVMQRDGFATSGGGNMAD
jgi:hypothetical protein